MKRPLVTTALFFCAGSFFGRYITDNTQIALFFIAVILICAAMTFYFKSVKCFLFLIIAAAGFININRITPPESVIANIPANFEAIVTRRQGSGYIVQTTDGVRFILYTEESLKPSDIITVSGTPRRTDVLRNPGGFDERAYYAARFVHYKIFADSVNVTGSKRGFAASLNTLRSAVTDVFFKVLPEKEAGIISSVVTGDRTQLMSEVKNLYSAGGIYHVLAISGLHISIIGLFLDALFRKFTSKRRAAVLVILILAAYAVLTGLSPSCVRATLIVSVMLFGRVIFRITDNLTSTAFAALCILTYSPFYLWDAGFLLSFSGFLGIILLTAPLERTIGIINTKAPCVKAVTENFWFKKSLMVSIAVFIAVLPICSDFLPRVPLYGILINLIVFPTFALLVALGFLCGVTGLFFLPIAEFLSGGIYYLLNFYEIILRLFTRLPFSSVLTGHIRWYAALLYYGGLACAAWYIYGLPFEIRRRFKYAAPALLAAAFFVHLTPSRGISVAMLDVGHGDSFVIKSGGFTAVIDGGGRQNAALGANTGARILTPYLEYLRTEEIDLVIVTHLDYDHAAGIIELLSEKKAKLVLLPSCADKTNELYAPLSQAAGDSLQFVSAGDVIKHGDITIAFLNPPVDSRITPNDGSVVARVSYKGVSFLFTSDITAQTESKLLTSDIRADVLKLSHHGSKHSNSEEFIETVNPALAISSYSKYNSYGLPADDVANILKARNIPLYETPECGAVIIKSYGKDITVKRTINHDYP